ncbi:MAG: hypothetical protein U0798_15475 [Gemmataceae bacterium]
MSKLNFESFSRLFPLVSEVEAVEVVDGSLVPEPYRRLLVHRFHMTVTVESYFGDRVNVNVVESKRRDDSTYSREIFLSLVQSGRIVQFGVVTIDLNALPGNVSEIILSEAVPLGRALIENNVLTTIEPHCYLKVALAPAFCERFQYPHPATTYGRIGQIRANGQPAIDVLEILVPGLVDG